MLILPFEETAVARVAFAMRAADAREIYATRWSSDPLQMVRELCAVVRAGAVAAANDGTPIAVVCAVHVAPRVLSVGMFATDRWPEIAVPLTGWCRKRFLPVLRATEAQRLECWSIDGHGQAHAWLERLGFKRELATKRGNAGELFWLYGAER